MIAHIIARLLLILCLLTPTALGAQEATAPDYKAWNKAAAAAEKQISTADAANTALETLRAELVTWRTTFMDAENLNAPRIDTLKAQISALGPVPSDGDAEAADIAQRRKDLTAQLETAQSPSRTAEEAYTRANGLISEIDTVLLERRTDALMELGPSPLNPTLWPTALKSVSQSAVIAWETVADNARSETGQAGLKVNMATILFCLSVALVLVARGRKWANALTEWVRARVHGAAGQGRVGIFGLFGPDHRAIGRVDCHHSGRACVGVVGTARRGPL